MSPLKFEVALDDIIHNYNNYCACIIFFLVIILMPHSVSSLIVTIIR